MHRLRMVAVAVLGLMAAGCASMISDAAGQLGEDLSAAVLDQDDLETVRDGAPAYLLMLDGLLRRDPENVTLLLAGARLYRSYAAAFVDDESRAARLTTKAHGYARQALCLRLADLCAALDGSFDDFVAALGALRGDDAPLLYAFAAAWAEWVRAHAHDWNAIAQLPKIEASMERVVVLDETIDGGSGHLYLAVLATRLAPSLGGRPEVGRRHFERAIALSGGQRLIAQVLYAERYARLTLDRALHDRLLNEVLAADPVAPGLTLSNTLAQDRARDLLESAGDFF